MRLDKITATRIARHYRDLEKNGRTDHVGKGQPLPANSIHKVHVVLGAILDDAIEDGHLTMNPTMKKRTVMAPKSSEIWAQKPEIVTWHADRLTTLLTWDRDELTDELLPLWRLVAYAGMRRSEAFAQRWNDINTKTMRICSQVTPTIQRSAVDRFAAHLGDAQHFLALRQKMAPNPRNNIPGRRPFSYCVREGTRTLTPYTGTSTSS